MIYNSETVFDFEHRMMFTKPLYALFPGHDIFGGFKLGELD